MSRFDKFFYGFGIGLLLPLLFIWVYLATLHPAYDGLLTTLSRIFPSILLGKLLIISILPDIVLFFASYKTDSFKISTGFMCGGMPYLIASFFMT
ncbi:MAG: hypothetical protein LBV31_02255 [Prevotellaceae bacterium]|jgi:glucan phosphoethanolaminetransferase (alkaline phosphatase superfamily)|nr:hypothetical protein [Prevotellaceae bacterium]